MRGKRKGTGLERVIEPWDVGSLLLLEETMVCVWEREGASEHAVLSLGRSELGEGVGAPV